MARAPSRLRRRRPMGRYRYVRWRWHVLFGLVDLLGDALCDWLTRFFIGRKKRNAPPTAPGSILLIQLDHLGDAVMTAAILPALRRRWPDARIEVLAAPWNREVFDNCDEVDAVHISSVNRFARGWHPHWPLALVCWGLRLRHKRFDLGIDVRGEFPFAAVLWLAGVKRRVGWDCGGGGFLITDSAKFVPGRPEMQSRMALLDLIGIDPPQDLLGKEPWFVPPAAARASVREKLAATDFVRSQAANRRDGQNSHEFCYGPLIVLHVGAGTAAKRWPVTHWRELLGRVIVEYGARIVLVGGRSDRAIARQILDGKPWPGVSDWTGQLSVVETAALIEQAELMIGADSGPAHLAAAVGTPAIVLFSGTNRVRQWRPWGHRVIVVKHSVACSPCHLQRCPLIGPSACGASGLRSPLAPQAEPPSSAGHPCMSGIAPETVMVRVRLVLGASDLEVRHPTETGTGATAAPVPCSL
ncbi:MAG TPA: glycosyltransferase family 9 protein [Pirellulales bacterium]|nr:glycosyltransferase family 9 protein [Pirellulales bacterium]